MLRAQDQRDLGPRRTTQQIDVTAAQAVHTRLVGQQSDPLAGDESDRVRQHDFDPWPHLCRRGGGRRGDRGRGGEYHQQRERMRAHRLLVVAAVLGCAGGRAGRPSPAPQPVPAPPTATVDTVASLLATLTVRQQVGQLVIPWLSGNYTALDDSLFQMAARWVDSLEVGGLIVSVGSPFDIAAKLNALQLRSRLPLLVSADLEWGAGMRVVGATAFPQIKIGRAHV